MSGVKLTGQMPKSRRVLSVVEAQAKAVTYEARDAALPIVRQEAPGRLGEALNGSVRQTKNGFRLTIQGAPRKKYKGRGATGAQVIRWVSRGTGIYRVGPGPKRQILAKHGHSMILPGGRRVISVKGQRPNPFMERAEPRVQSSVQRVVWLGAQHAANELRKL